MKSLFKLIIIIVFISCHQIELPLMMDEPPIFDVQATVGNQVLPLAAGKNNYVLYTDFESTQLNIIESKGAFIKRGCNLNCPGTLTIVIRTNARDYRSSASEIIKPGRLPYYKAVSDSLKINTKNTSVLSNAAKYDFTWTVNERKFISIENLNAYIKPDHKNQICMYIKHPDGSDAKQCQVLDYSLLDSFPGLKVSFLLQNDGGKGWQLNPRIAGIGPFKFIWSDKTTGPVIAVDAKAGSRHCLTVIDQQGNTAESCIEVNPEGKIKTQADFEILAETTRLKEWTQANTVRISYINDKGLEFVSEEKAQSGDAFFEVLEVKDYEINANKQATKKLKIKFKSILSNRQGERLPVSGEGTIGIATPR